MKRIKLYNRKQTINAIKVAFIVFVAIIAAVLLLINCSSQSHFTNSETNPSAVVVYCGKLENITQATKRFSIIKTDKTEFFVFGTPNIQDNSVLYITFKEETIMPTMTVQWVPYLIVNNKKHRVNEYYTDEKFYSDITYANIEVEY